MPSKKCSSAKEIYRVSLLNKNKYGYDVKDNVLRITLLRGPIYPDFHADKGKHKVYYRLYPHKNNWQNAKTSNFALDYNYPFLIKEEENHKRELPQNYSFYSSKVDNVLISVLKKAEDSEAVILRVVENAGKNTTATITLPQVAKKVFETDLLERNLKEISKQKNKIIAKS